MSVTPESTAHEQVVPNHPVASATAARHRSGLRRKKNDLWPSHGFGPRIDYASDLADDADYTRVTYSDGAGRDVLTMRVEEKTGANVTVTWSVTNDEAARLHSEVTVTDASGEPDPERSGSPLESDLLVFATSGVPSAAQINDALGA